METIGTLITYAIHILFKIFVSNVNKRKIYPMAGGIFSAMISGGEVLWYDFLPWFYKQTRDYLPYSHLIMEKILNPLVICFDLNCIYEHFKLQLLQLLKNIK